VTLLGALAILAGFSLVVAPFLIGRLGDRRWAHRRDMRALVTPPHTSGPRYVAGLQHGDERGRPC